MGNRLILSMFSFGFSAVIGSISFAGPISATQGSILQGEGCTWQQKSNGYETQVSATGTKCVKAGTFGQEVAAPQEVYFPVGSSEPKKKDPAKNQQRAPAAVNRYAGQDCNAQKLPFNKLDYVGINFQDRLKGGGRCTVVSGKTDGQASQFCKGGYLINPGNPQYLDPQSRGVYGVYGDLSSNTEGYYFCIMGGNFNKQQMCNEMRDAHPKLSVVFKPITRGGDGDCLCGPAGSTRKEDCSQKDLSNLADDSCKPIEGKMPNPSTEPGQAACVCDTQKGFKENEKGGCDKVAAASTVGSGDVTKAVLDCVKKYEDEATNCEAKAKAAKQTCDQENKDNPEVVDAMNSASKVTGLFINQNAGKGTVSECIQAGALASSPQIILNSMKETCETNFTECSNLCNSEEKVQQYTQECGALAKQAAQGAVQKTGTEENNKNVLYFQEKLASIQKLQDSGTEMCKQDASKNRGILGDVLAGLGKSVAGALKCACQLSTNALGTTQSTCDSLPSSGQCTANPSLAGCPAVIAVDICTPGSMNYSYKGCECQQNPKGIGCPEYAAMTPGLNGFAGMDIGSGSSSGGASFGAPNSSGDGGLSASDLNLNGNTASELASGNKTPGITAGFPGGGGGGGGGGGLAAPGGGEGGAAGSEGDGENKGGLAGAFGMAKSIAGSLFGGGANKKNDSSAAKGNSNFNMNKYRPNGSRGVASDQYGGKTSEIWNMMHEHYGENHPTFIQNP